MTRERYFQWMRIWECIGAGDGTLQIDNLYSLLDVLWQEERKNSSEVFRPRWLISSSAQET
jgi:hypothetical protein